MAGSTDEKPLRICPSAVITRQSTDIDAIQSPLVLKALRYIQQHLSGELTPDFVARQCGVTRRQLDLRFQETLDQSVSQEIVHARIRQARELLAFSDMDIDDIAKAVGMPGITTFYRQFGKRCGVTPHHYRKRRHQH
jgi:LacI family transcriptional regulator